MIQLLFTVLANVLIFIIFKHFQHYRVDTFQAIVVNYLFFFWYLFLSHPERRLCYYFNIQYKEYTSL